MIFEYDEEYVISNLRKDVRELTEHANFIMSLEHIDFFIMKDYNDVLVKYNSLCAFLNEESKVAANEDDVYGALEEIRKDTRSLNTKFINLINRTFDKYSNPIKSKIEELTLENKKILDKVKNLKPIINKVDEKELTRIETDKVLQDNINNTLGMFGVLDSENITGKLEQLLKDFKDFTIIDNLTKSVLDLTNDSKQQQIYDSNVIETLLKEFKPSLTSKILCSPLNDKRLVIGFIGQNCYLIEKCKFMNTKAKSIPYKYSIKKYQVKSNDIFDTPKEIVIPNKNEILKLINLTNDILNEKDKLEKKILGVIKTDNDFVKSIGEQTNWENIGLYGIYIESLYVMLKLYNNLPKSILSIINMFINTKAK